MALPEIPEDLENLVKTREVLKELRDGVSVAAGVQVDGSTPFTGDQSMGGHKLTNVQDPTAAQDAATKNYVDNIPLYVKKDGSTPFTGDQSMGTHKLTNVVDPGSAQDAATKNYVDTSSANTNFIKKDGSVAFTGDESMGGHKLTNVAAPAAGGDATNKTYVDGLDAGNIKKNGSVAFTADQSMGGFKLTNLAAPATGLDATNKAYVDAVSTGIVQGGRLERTSSTVVTLQQYTGDIQTVNGEAVVLPVALSSTDNRIDSTGADAGAALAASTLYYVYISNSLASFAPSDLRASLTAPNTDLYLGGTGNAANWRFVGWVRTNASTQFEDNTTNRLVVNYFNRVKRPLLANPGYVDDNADTSYALASATWVALNGGTGSRVSFISNGEDSVTLGYDATVELDVGGGSSSANACIAVGVDTTSNPDRASKVASANSSTTNQYSVTGTFDTSLSTGYHVADIIGYAVTVGGGSSVSILADFARGGASADPMGTRLEGAVWV